MTTGKHAATAAPETWAAARSEVARDYMDSPGNHVTYPERENKPDLGIAYILLLLGGMFGIHRIYADPQSKSGFTMLIMTLCIIGIPVTVVWWVVDLFLLPSVVRESTR